MGAIYIQSESGREGGLLRLTQTNDHTVRPLY